MDTFDTTTILAGIGFITAMLGLWWKIINIKKYHQTEIENRVVKEKDLEHRLHNIEIHGSGNAIRRVDEMEKRVDKLETSIHDVEISTKSHIERVSYKTEETFKTVFKQLDKIEKSTACLQQMKVDLEVIKNTLKQIGKTMAKVGRPKKSPIDKANNKKDTYTPRVDGFQGRANIAKSIDKPIVPPIPLHVEEQDIFNSIISRRPNDQWPEDDIYVAAQLAKCLYLLQMETQRIEEEGTVGKDGKKNQRVAVKQTLTNEMVTLRRTLGLQAGSESGSMQRKRKSWRIGSEIQKKMQDARQGYDEETLKLIK